MQIFRIKQNYRTIQLHHLFMLGACREFCIMLLPSMHCSKVLLIVPIVEINTLIIDVCVCHHIWYSFVLMFVKVF